MKRSFIILIIIILAVIAFFVFGNNQNKIEKSQSPAKKTTLQDGTYTLKNGSVLSWRGHKTLLDKYFDNGIVGMSDGTLTIEDSVVTGSFTVDMTTIRGEETSNTSLGLDMLSNHLKSDAFFNVETYPTATFTITNMVPEQSIAGNFLAEGTLTIKGIAQSISFPAVLSYLEDDALRIIGQVTLDRTLWDIRFGSAKFFNDLADNVISDDMDISFDILLIKGE